MKKITFFALLVGGIVCGQNTYAQNFRMASQTSEDRQHHSLNYVNHFKTQADFEKAIQDRLTFKDVSLNHRDLILRGGEITTMPMDLSGNNAVTTSFEARTLQFEDQEVMLSISTDNGASYTPLRTFKISSETFQHSHIINLEDFDAPQGMLKISMVDPSSSIALSNLNIQNFSGFIYTNGGWIPSDPSGISTSSDDFFIANGSITLDQSTVCRNLQIDPGATLRIESTLDFSGNLTILGDLIFVSSATKNGELGRVALTSQIIGESTVERHISANRAYRMLASAVTTTTSIHENWQEGATSNTDNPAPGYGTHITGSQTDQQNGFDGTLTGNASMFTVNLATQEFTPVPNTNTLTLKAGNPYLLFVRGDRSIDLTNNFASGETVLRAKGKLQKGTKLQLFSTVNAGDFAMMGNPYQATIDMSLVLLEAENINPNSFFVYDPTLGSHGGYVTVDVATGTNTSGSAANNYLQPGQAVQLSTIDNGPAAIPFSEDYKAIGNFTNTNKSSVTSDKLTVQLFTLNNFKENGTLHDSFGIIFDDAFDNAVTIQDAPKPFNFTENIAIKNEEKLLSLERRQMPVTGEIFQLYTSGYSQEDYVLYIKLDGLENNNLTLVDHHNGARTPITTEGISYEYKVTQSEPTSGSEDRFTIEVMESVLEIETMSILEHLRIYPNPFTGDRFNVTTASFIGEQITFKISDMRGREIMTQEVLIENPTTNFNIATELQKEIYLVTLETSKGSKTIKVIKE